jgi:hypothetical protein
MVVRRERCGQSCRDNSPKECVSTRLSRRRPQPETRRGAGSRSRSIRHARDRSTRILSGDKALKPMEPRNPGDREAFLDAIFRAYRAACPDSDASANFMPNLWARIEVREVSTKLVCAGGQGVGSRFAGCVGYSRDDFIKESVERVFRRDLRAVAPGRPCFETGAVSPGPHFRIGSSVANPPATAESAGAR